MKARAQTPLFEQAHIAPLRTLTPTPLPEGEGFVLPPLPLGEADARERVG